MRDKCVRCGEQRAYTGLYCDRCKRDNDSVYMSTILPVVDFTPMPSYDPTPSYDYNSGPSYEPSPSFDSAFDGGSSGGGGGGSDY